MACEGEMLESSIAWYNFSKFITSKHVENTVCNINGQDLILYDLKTKSYVLQYTCLFTEELNRCFKEIISSTAIKY